MSVTIKAVVEGFELFFSGLLRDDFRKTYNFKHWNEAEMLPLVRAFLLGYFGGKVRPEVKAKLPGSRSGYGRIDFQIDDVAVEFAVRRKDDSKASLSDRVNANEMKKLLKFDGKALLVLFDFSNEPFDEVDIHRFRDWPSLGRGNHNKSAFNVAYFYLYGGGFDKYDVMQANIRV